MRGGEGVPCVCVSDPRSLDGTRDRDESGERESTECERVERVSTFTAFSAPSATGGARTGERCSCCTLMTFLCGCMRVGAPVVCLYFSLYSALYGYLELTGTLRLPARSRSRSEFRLCFLRCAVSGDERTVERNHSDVKKMFSHTRLNKDREQEDDAEIRPTLQAQSSASSISRDAATHTTHLTYTTQNHMHPKRRAEVHTPQHSKVTAHMQTVLGATARGYLVYTSEVPKPSVQAQQGAA